MTLPADTEGSVYGLFRVTGGYGGGLCGRCCKMAHGCHLMQPWNSFTTGTRECSVDRVLKSEHGLTPGLTSALDQRTPLLGAAEAPAWKLDTREPHKRTDPRH